MFCFDSLNEFGGRPWKMYRRKKHVQSASTKDLKRDLQTGLEGQTKL